MFYTNFIAKLKEEKLNQLEESYLFRLSYAKFMPHIIILSICLVMIPFLLIIFKKEGLNNKIVFEHPEAYHSCGCGESFAIKKETI